MSDLHAAISEVDERKAFEEWAKGDVGPVLPDGTLGYFYSDVRAAWRAWQARAALSAPAVPPAVIAVAREFVNNGYRGPLNQARLVFDYVAALADAPSTKEPT